MDHTDNTELLAPSPLSCSRNDSGLGSHDTLFKFSEELEESHQRFKDIAEHLPGVICELDLALKVTFVNKPGLALFQYTDEDFEKGIFAQQLFDEEVFRRALVDITNIISGGEFGKPCEYRMRRKDGGAIHVLVNTCPLFRRGELVGTRHYLVDITSRVEAQEMVERSEERFRTIFDHSPVGVGIFSSKGILQQANASLSKLLSRMSKASAGELSVSLSSLIFGPHGSELQRLLSGDKSEIHCEQWYSYEKGSPKSDRICLEWWITTLRAGKESEFTLLAQVHDVTARKRIEESAIQGARAEAKKANRMVEGLRRELVGNARFHSMVSNSPQMKQVFQMLPEISTTSVTVLVWGESGTGKELVARCLHELGDRRTKPFVAINCGALPDNLLESELFGYKAGAFTDAKKDKTGKLALAQHGTLLLDEIGDISPAMQVKLLRVLQERTFEPLGSTESVSLDVRVIAATNKDLQSMVRAGEFREDLYYRIAVLTVELPPLRERRCDIPLLCDHFIHQFNTRYRKEISGISDEALDALMSHHFPGNIRELENAIEHAFIFCKQDTIQLKHLPQEILGAHEKEVLPQFLSGIRDFRELERIYLRSVLAECGGNRIRTARKLGIHKATLFRKLKSLDIQDA